MVWAMSLYRALWPLIRALDPEDAHLLTLRALNMGAGHLWPPPRNVPELEVDVLGLRFANPIGIAAGFDKDGVAASRCSGSASALSSWAR